MMQAFVPLRMLRVLTRHDVRFVVVGDLIEVEILETVKEEQHRNM